MDVTILTLIAALCGTTDFRVQMKCQKELINCVISHRAQTPKGQEAFGLALCITDNNKLGGGWSIWGGK